MAQLKLSITLNNETIDEIDARRRAGLTDEIGGRSTIIERDLNRYYQTIETAREELREMFDEAELAALVLAALRMRRIFDLSADFEWYLSTLLQTVQTFPYLEYGLTVDVIRLTALLRDCHRIHLIAIQEAAEHFVPGNPPERSFDPR